MYLFLCRFTKPLDRLFIAAVMDSIGDHLQLQCGQCQDITIICQNVDNVKIVGIDLAEALSLVGLA